MRLDLNETERVESGKFYMPKTDTFRPELQPSLYAIDLIGTNY
jgi:hypothetical protein